MKIIKDHICKLYQEGAHRDVRDAEMQVKPRSKSIVLRQFLRRKENSSTIIVIKYAIFRHEWRDMTLEEDSFSPPDKAKLTQPTILGFTPRRARVNAHKYSSEAEIAT